MMEGDKNKLASDTAMVLAAGLGTRMRPLTNDRPKPLVMVAGKPLIDHALDHLVDAGITHAVVNVHYLADQLERHVLARKQPHCIISDERAHLLETGGGMAHAMAQDLLPDPFFCLNSDNVWLNGTHNAFHALSLVWQPAVMDALLLLIPQGRAGNYRGRGDFHLANDAHGKGGDRHKAGRIARPQAEQDAPFVFTGIQLVAHRLLRDAPDGAFSTNIVWDRAIGEGRLYGTVFDGTWFEVGEPAAIAPAAAALSS